MGPHAHVWNQHSHHSTDVNADGSLPKAEQNNWANGAPNNYRVSTQDAGSYNTPDLKVDLEVSNDWCPTGLRLRARVKNEGSLGVPAGVKIRSYEESDATGKLLHEAATTKALLPGQSELASTCTRCPAVMTVFRSTSLWTATLVPGPW